MVGRGRSEGEGMVKRGGRRCIVCFCIEYGGCAMFVDTSM